jgi:hypothetical protein
MQPVRCGTHLAISSFFAIAAGAASNTTFGYSNLLVRGCEAQFYTATTHWESPKSEEKLKTLLQEG